MKKLNSHVPLPTGRVISRPVSPNLQELTSTELIDLFVEVGKLFTDSIQRGAGVNELDELQLQIATIKDELHKKGNLSPEATLRNNFFYLSAIEKS
jgi:hypothetical protein